MLFQVVMVIETHLNWLLLKSMGMLWGELPEFVQEFVRGYQAKKMTARFMRGWGLCWVVRVVLFELEWKSGVCHVRHIHTYIQACMNKQKHYYTYTFLHTHTHQQRSNQLPF